MDDHLASFLTHLMTFAVTIAGIVGGTIRSRNKAELAFANSRSEFYQKELEQSRLREIAAIEREDGLRKEVSSLQHESIVMHHEYEAARQSRMVKGNRSNSALVVIDGDSEIVDASENIFLFSGWRASEIIGKPIEILVPEEDRPGHKEAILNASRTGKRVIRGEDSFDSRLGLRQKDGKTIPVTVAIIGGGKGKDARYTGSIRMRSSDSVSDTRTQ